MQYDPIQAFLSGISSTFARIFLVVAAFLLALLCYTIPGADLSSLATVFLPFVAFVFFPFATLGTIFAWANSGVFLFFIGLLSLIAFLFLAWQFMEASDPKGVFLLLFTSAFIFFIPLTWVRDFPIWRWAAVSAGFFASYFLLGYVLPATARHPSKNRES